MINPVQNLGRAAIEAVRTAGAMQIFLNRALIGAFTPPLRLGMVVNQCHFLGVKSTVVILLTGVFTGMVLGLQGYYTLRNFGSEAMLGAGVVLSLVRELGPVLAALMVTGRAGSAMAAELGIMRITEQINALDAMNLDPIKFLISPRLAASIITMPLLTSVFVCVGVVGSWTVAVWMMGLNPGVYYEGLITSVTSRDLLSGLIKTLVFGATIGIVCGYKGFTSGHGAEGVGRATTEAVVASSVLILLWDYLLTSMTLYI